MLLDTNALLWTALAPAFLSTSSASIIGNEENDVLVSAASAWEVATKVRIGKLPMAELFERNFIDVVRAAGYRILPIQVEVALLAGRLAGEHRDPFDRMIAAQALLEGVAVLSPDSKLEAFGVRRIW